MPIEWKLLTLLLFKWDLVTKITVNILQLYNVRFTYVFMLNLRANSIECPYKYLILRVPPILHKFIINRSDVNLFVNNSNKYRMME